MSRWKIAGLVVAVWAVASVTAGLVGAGMATVLVTEFTERNASAPSDAPDAEALQIESAALGETRHVTVHLPDFYARDTDTHYPVWVTLDGDWNGPVVADAARTFDRAELAPGHLVVAVGNVPRGRDHDLLPPDVEVEGATGGADALLAFIETELLPRVARDYRTTDVRLLSGHSRGGLFVAYALDARPDLFDGAFAFSPSFWAGDGADADRLIALAASGRTDATVVLTIGDEDGPMRTHFDRVAAVAAETAGWSATVIEGASHGATLRLSAPAALRAHYGER